MPKSFPWRVTQKLSTSSFLCFEHSAISIPSFQIQIFQFVFLKSQYNFKYSSFSLMLSCAQSRHIDTQIDQFFGLTKFKVNISESKIIRLFEIISQSHSSLAILSSMWRQSTKDLPLKDLGMPQVFFLTVRANQISSVKFEVQYHRGNSEVSYSLTESYSP
jgi:hypothetical protein